MLSGPPPRGSIVVRVAVRLFRGTGGNNRRPERRQEGEVREMQVNFKTLTLLDDKGEVWHLFNVFTSGMLLVTEH